MKQSIFLSLKEFVIVLLLACVETVIGLVVTMPFAANLQLVYFLAPGLAGLINGIIYVLIIKKCPKIGTQFIIPAIYGLYFLFSGSVYVFIFFMILAVVNELIMLAADIEAKFALCRSSYAHLDAQRHGQHPDDAAVPGTAWLRAMCPWVWTQSVRMPPLHPWRASGCAAEHCHSPGGCGGAVHRRLCAGDENAGQTL